MSAQCSVEGCERPRSARGYCRTHYARWQRHGHPQADLPIESKTSGGVGYWSSHQRVKALRGPARAHPCADCGAPACDWSYDGADPDERIDPDRGYRYSLDPGHYRARCRSCHRRATVAQAPPRRGAPVADPARAAQLYRAGATTRGIARYLGTSRTAVTTALRAQNVPMRPRGTRGPNLP